MTQIPILSGIYTDTNSDFRTAYPRNLVPVMKTTGISDSYLRPADGIVQLGTGPGTDRGGINWDGTCYRVMGSKLVSIGATGVTTTLGDVGNNGQSVTFDYSFDRLAIASNGNLFYWDGATLTQVSDTDLGTVVDMIWVDGYFMTTDGQYLIVTELNDPTQVDPIKYGSSEADPDPIKALIKLRNEPYALNRNTIEVFQNVGGITFPFQRIEGGQIMRGTVGSHTCCAFIEALAFVGGGRNEAIAVWLGSNGQSTKISTREIDQILAGYTEDTLSECVLESRVFNSYQHLYFHLPDQTLVYDAAASQIAGQPVWFQLTSSLVGLGQYRARNFVYCYNRWLAGDPTSNKHGYLTDTLSSHYGDVIGWDVYTMIVYNEGKGVIFHELELVCLTGRAALGVNPTIWTSYSLDGLAWSQEHGRTAGKQGQTLKRLNWLQQGYMRTWRIQRFRGTSDAMLAIARIEARLEACNV